MLSFLKGCPDKRCKVHTVSPRWRLPGFPCMGATNGVALMRIEDESATFRSDAPPSIGPAYG
jgi:hypothetical protein